MINFDSLSFQSALRHFLSTIGFVLQLAFRIKLTMELYLKLIKLIHNRKNNSNFSEPNSKNLVVLTTDFLPSIHGGVYRPLSWLRNSSQNAFHLVVHSNSSIRPEKIGESIINDLNLASRIKYCREAEFEVLSRPSRLLVSRPEFMFAALENLEQQHKVFPISHLIASGPDFTSFIVAAIFAHKHNCYLHLDYRDEWTLSPFEFSQPSKFSRIIERCCINLADSISMTTQSQIDYFQKYFGRSKIINLNPNGCELFPVPIPYSKIASAKITICHSGSIGKHNSFKDFANYVRLLELAINEKNHQLHLQFLGKIDESYQSLLVDSHLGSIQCFGQLSPEDAFLQSSHADLCLLLIDERYDRYIPGKLYSYIASGRPILIFGASQSHEILALCNEFNVPHYFVENESSMDLTACVNFICNSRNLETPISEVKRFQSNMNRQKIAENFFKALGCK